MKKFSLTVCLLSIFYSFSFLHAQDQLAIWTFDGLNGITSGTEISPTADDVIGQPVVQQFNQDIDDNGTSDAIAYTDVAGVAHLATRAIQWDDIKGSGDDAVLDISINTTGFTDLFLRFNYNAESANTVDLEYSTDGGATFSTKIFNNFGLTADESWRTAFFDLSAENALENEPNLVFRLSDWENNGNDQLSIDNIEIFGTKAAPDPNAPDMRIAANSTFDRYLPTRGGGLVTSTIGDPEDLAATRGIDFILTDPNYPATDLNLSFSSSNTTVVPLSNFNVVGSNSIRNIDIIPAAVGKSFIVITVTNPDGLTANYEIDFAASQAERATQSWHFGSSDASAGLVVNNLWILVANDEDETIRMHLKERSSGVLNSYDFSGDLGKVDSREVDLEACTKVGNTIYWMGSHSNNNSGDDRPNRERIFSTTLGGAPHINATLTFNGYYSSLETDLIDWDDNNDHGLGASFFGLGASAAATVDPKTSGGFNIEGLTMAPNSTTTAFIGFRAPYASASTRDKALVIPITNFTSLPGSSPGSATFGAPIQLDLAGRGIRSIECNNNGCLLIAGPAGNPSPTDTFDLYFWSGNSVDPAELLPTTPSLGQLGWEGIVDLPNNFNGNKSVLMLTDRGTTDYYGTGEEAKDLPSGHQKFSSEYVSFFRCTFSFSLNSPNKEICKDDVLSFTPDFTFSTAPTSATYSYKIINGAGFGELTHNDLSSASFSFEAKDVGITDIRLIVTDQDGCQDSADFTIKILDLTIAGSIEAGPVCEGSSEPIIDNLVLNGTAPYEYDYQIIGGSGQASITHPNTSSSIADINGITAGTVDIRLYITEVGACTDSIDFTVTVKPTPVQLAEQNCTGCNQIRVEVCQFEQLPDLEDLVINDNSNYEVGNSLQWYKNRAGAPGAALASAPSPNTNKPKTRKYWVSQIKDGCESDPIQVRVRVLPATDVAFNLAPIGCEGAQIDLAAWVSDALETANSYTFYDSDPTQGSPQAIGSVTATMGQVNNMEYVIIDLIPGSHTYYVIADNASGCTSMAQATIIVSERPVVNLISDVSAAHGDPIQVNLSGNLPGLQFVWFNDNTATGLGASGLGAINFVADNTSGQAQLSTVRVLAINNNCTSNSFESFSITVNPALLRQSQPLSSANFLNFMATQANEANVRLSWESSFEHLIEGYEVEKKRNSEGKFTALAGVSPRGDKSTYSLLDQEGMGNQNIYRLKVVMTDGSIQYSEEIAVGFDFYHNDRFVIYPNPSKGRFTLEAKFPVDETYAWKLTNLLGQEVKAGNLTQQRESFDLTTLPQGIYHLIMTSQDGKRYLNRVIIE